MSGLEAGVNIYHPESRMGRDGHSYSVPSLKRVPAKTTPVATIGDRIVKTEDGRLLVFHPERFTAEFEIMKK